MGPPLVLKCWNPAIENNMKNATQGLKRGRLPPASAPLFIVLCHWSALLTGAQIGLPHLRTSLQSVFNPVVVISLFFLSPAIRSSDAFSAQSQGWSRTYEMRAISVEILNPYGS